MTVAILLPTHELIHSSQAQVSLACHARGGSTALMRKPCRQVSCELGDDRQPRTCFPRHHMV